jgi:hypothetical protein
VSIALLDTYSFVPGVHVVATPTGKRRPVRLEKRSWREDHIRQPEVRTVPRGDRHRRERRHARGNRIRQHYVPGRWDATPFLIEEITTVGAADHVADLLASLDDSIHGCMKLTMSIPSAKSSTMTVSPAPAPPHGDHPTAGHIVGSSGASKGIYLTLVATGVQDAVITLTFIQESESDIQGITKEAVERATAVFVKAA